MKKTYVSVCKNVIQRNNKIKREGLDEALSPPIRIQNGKWGDKTTCTEAVFKDAAGNIVGRIFYETDPILKCGAKVAIEFYGDVEVVA